MTSERETDIVRKLTEGACEEEEAVADEVAAEEPCIRVYPSWLAEEHVVRPYRKRSHPDFE